MKPKSCSRAAPVSGSGIVGGVGSWCQVSVLQGLGHCCRAREGNTCWGLEG